MAEETQRAYPLYWPEGWPRTPRSAIKKARFGDHSVLQGRRRLTHEVRLFGATNLIISSNLELRLDGNPRSNQRQPDDRGVACFFTFRKEPKALACDIYSTVEDNLWALCRTLDALRQLGRDGSPTIIDRAFKGFAALPDPNHRMWWDVLLLRPDASREEKTDSYRALAKRYHPDNSETGNAELFLQVQKAYEESMENA